MTIRTRTLPRTSQRAKGEKLSPWRHLVGIVLELMTMSPTPEYFKPFIIDQDTDENGYTVLYIRASNARDLNRFTDGVSVAGGRIVCTKLGKHTWKISTE